MANMKCNMDEINETKYQWIHNGWQQKIPVSQNQYSQKLISVPEMPVEAT